MLRGRKVTTSDLETPNFEFDSCQNYCRVDRILEDTMRMFFFALKPCIAVRVGTAMPV